MIAFAGPNFARSYRRLDGCRSSDRPRRARSRGSRSGDRSGGVGEKSRKQACGVPAVVVDYLGSGETILTADATRKTSP